MFSGFIHCPLEQMLSVCRNVIVSLWRSRFGSRVQAFFALCSQVLTIRVVALCCFSHLFLLFVCGLMTMAVLSSVNSPTVVKFFVLPVCMRQIATSSARSSLVMSVGGLTLLFPQFCGDFNAVFDRLLDRVGSDPVDTVWESSEALAHLFSSYCVTDILCYLYPSTDSFTWSRWNGLVASRIDLLGCPHAWISSVGGCDILPFPFSDHCALFFSVSVPDAISPGPGLWKLNSSILDESEFILFISSFWSFWHGRIFPFSSLAEWWDAGKAQIRRLSIDYCRNQAKAKHGERDLLSQLVSFLRRNLMLALLVALPPIILPSLT